MVEVGGLLRDCVGTGGDGLTGGVEHHILRFDVGVNDVAIVHLAERGEHLAK